MWIQREITLEPRPRGFHLVTREVVGALPELAEVEVGLAHLFIQHTSASLALNENASPDVRRDFASWFDEAVPERAPMWTHTLEGPDDMPAHIKASLLGPSLSLPIAGGRLALGTWQGIYLCEHRNAGGARRLLATLWGSGAWLTRAAPPRAPDGRESDGETMAPADILQLLGAIAILIAFIGVQLRLTDPNSYPSLVLNLGGSILLAVLALADRQWGFLLLEAVWAVVSAWGLLSRLSGRSAPAT